MTDSTLQARIVAAAAKLIAEGGREAATTRAVALEAGVQAPTIYRMFGDMSGLYSAVAAQVMRDYVAGKADRKPHPDPMQDLRDGWDMHVAFALAHPHVFAILSVDGAGDEVADAGKAVLLGRIRRIGKAGRLRISEERAFALVRSMGVGVVLHLLAQPAAARDLGLSEVAREAVMAAICGEPRSDGTAPGAASALASALDEVGGLTPGEMHLLRELLQRIADGGARR